MKKKSFLLQSVEPTEGLFDELDVVDKYRLYYIFDKSAFAEWPIGKIPKWYEEGLKEYGF